jgi:pimeloyl-ACP methyl ester carboxylesterase
MRIEVLHMSAFRICLAVIALTAILAAPASAQVAPAAGPMTSDLVRSLREEKVQRALIAVGSLDAVLGRASRLELRAAIERFRKAYSFKDGSGPVTDQERAKLQDLYDKFKEATGLKQRTCEDPASKTKLSFYLPEKLVSSTGLGDTGQCSGEWSAYIEKDWKLAIGPQIYPLAVETPISLFRKNIMKFSIDYSHLHLTSEEFTAEGEVANDIGGYVSYNLAFTIDDQVKALFMSYAKRPPQDFKVPDFLLPMLEAESQAPGSEDPDPRTRGWLLLMQGVTNLLASDFPFDNGWKKASSRVCPQNRDMGDGQPRNIRILFGTDRLMKSQAPRDGTLVSPDALFGNEPSYRLHMGCAYVTPPVAGSDANKPIAEYHLFHQGEKGDLGERTYLTDEIGQGLKLGTTWVGGDALVFIHGYNVAFKDALFTAAKIVADTDYKGRVYMYSWPSAVSTLGYFQDLDTAEQAEPFFQSFLRMLMRDANINQIDLLAHSMGSQSLLRAVSALRPIFETARTERFMLASDRRLALERKLALERRGMRTAGSIRVGQMIFAAPDVARSIFDQKINRIAPYADRITVYVSSTDLALSTSQLIRGGLPRMGELSDGEPALIDNGKVHLIDATPKSQSWFQRLFGGGYGHDYLSQAMPVLEDIQDILKARRANDRSTPDERSSKRFEKVAYKGTTDKFFWRLIEK